MTEYQTLLAVVRNGSKIELTENTIGGDAVEQLIKAAVAGGGAIKLEFKIPNDFMVRWSEMGAGHVTFVYPPRQ